MGVYNQELNSNIYISEALDEKCLEEGGVIYHANGRLNKRLKNKFKCGRLQHFMIEHYKNGQLKCVGNIYFDHKGYSRKSYNNSFRY